MPRAMFFIKIARSYLFTSASASFCPRFCFLLLSLRASLYSCPRFLLFPPRASLYSHLCFHLSLPRTRSASRHPRFTSRRSFSHDFSLPRHTLFDIKPCIANSFSVIWLFCVQRHTFFLTKVCIASRVGAVCSIVEACRRVPHAATHPFRHETMYREQFSCHLAMFHAATHLFPHKSLYREQGWDGLLYRLGVQACSSCRDTPFSALNRVSRAVFLSFGHVSCRDTHFSAQKSVSRPK